jgi:hypothetical protein
MVSRGEDKGANHSVGLSVTTLMPGPTETEFFERADMLDTKVGADDGRANCLMPTAPRPRRIARRPSPGQSATTDGPSLEARGGTEWGAGLIPG